MQMNQIEVSLIDQEIILSQPDDYGFSQIVITVEQAKFVCQWIMEAAKAGRGEQG